MSALPSASRGFDVVVVGAGPAGSVCARELARARLRVALIDRAAPPRYKTCGGGIVVRALKALELDLDGVVERECRVAEMRVAGGETAFRVERERPLVTMTMRADLDRLLLERAAAAGAEVIVPCAFEGLDTTTEGLLVRTNVGLLRARYAVAADGALSALARAAGWPDSSVRVPALESEVRVGPADLERYAYAARFDVGEPRHGYAWVFPKRGHLSVGCLTTVRRDALPLRQALERYLERLGLGAVEREDHGFLIPVRPRGRVLARDRVLLTGDAAGLADPVTCEGISHAVASAKLAAAAIARACDRPEEVYASYHSGLEREILGELRLARILAGVLYQRVRLRLAVFQRSGRPLCEAVAEVITGTRSYRSLLGRPANYFRFALAVARGSYAAS